MILASALFALLPPAAPPAWSINTRDVGVHCSCDPPTVDRPAGFDCAALCDTSRAPSIGGFIGAGGMSFEDQMALGVFNMALNSVMQGMFSRPAYQDPRQEALRQQAIELEQRQQAERDAARARKFRQDRDELLSQLMGRKFMEDLKFKSLGKTPAGELRFKSLGSAKAPAAPAEDKDGDARRRALAKLKGQEDEKWCKAHLASALCPVHPVYDMGKLYESRVAAYHAARKEWDRRCGGPSAQPGYVDDDSCGKEAARPQQEASTLNFLPLSKDARARAAGPAAAPARSPETVRPMEASSAGAAPERPAPPAPPAKAPVEPKASQEPGKSAETASGRGPAPEDRAASEPRTGGLRSKDTLDGAAGEEIKAAGAGGFDKNAPLLGDKGKSPALAPSADDAARARGSGAGTAASAPAPRGASAPGTAASSPPAGVARPGAPLTGAYSMEKDPYKAREPNAPVELLKPKEHKLLGDPFRFAKVFQKQSGETCSLVAAIQLLSEIGIRRTEEDLFRDALLRGDFVDPHPCGHNAGLTCGSQYNLATGHCYETYPGGAIGKESAAYCVAVRKRGGAPWDGIVNILRHESGRDVGGSFLQLSGKKAFDAGSGFAARLERQLEEANRQLWDALKGDRAVLLGVDSETLYSDPYRTRQHVIVVTSAALDERGEPVGYYFNDSNLDYQARYITRPQLEQAWKQDHLFRAYLP